MNGTREINRGRITKRKVRGKSKRVLLPLTLELDICVNNDNFTFNDPKKIDVEK